MRLSESIAHILTQRRGAVWAAVLLLVAICVALLVTRMSLDSDIINMLPSNFSSVDALKVYNRDFEQTRELTFALLCQPEDVEKLDEFAPIFADLLRKQSWCERVLAGSPMETPEGVHDLQSMAVPLLLNLEPPDFARSLEVLEPTHMQERLHRLREQMEAGSPRPQF